MFDNMYETLVFLHHHLSLAIPSPCWQDIWKFSYGKFAIGFLQTTSKI